MKISFDFDRTLANIRIQKLARLFIQHGHDVYITTSRKKESEDYTNEDLYLIAEIVGISKENIRFTDGEDKWLFLDGFDVHFDDDPIEAMLIERNKVSCAPVLIS